MSAPQLVNGREFILEAPEQVPAIFGREGGEVLWAKGEPFIICGPQGVGKTTLAQQLVLHRIGVRTGELIGYPVIADDRPTLYIAADRPQQAARSFRRMVTDSDAELLADRLRVWRGPLPFDLVADPTRFASFVQSHHAGTVVVDSLKDIASPLSSDDVGSAYNRAVAGAIAAGIEVLVLHHQRKATSDNKAPRTLSDVYGSTWITSGAGSVVCLWGEPGDPLVELTHLKQPADDVGRIEIEHDNRTGATTVRDHRDIYSLLVAATVTGLTAPDAAAAVYGKPTRAQLEKIRRRLERYADDDLARRVKGKQPTDPVTYIPIGQTDSVYPRVAPRVAHTEATRSYTKPGNTAHAAYTDPVAQPSTPLRGDGERERVATENHSLGTPQEPEESNADDFDRLAAEGLSILAAVSDSSPATCVAGQQGDGQ